jgi:hypothetical protein
MHKTSRHNRERETRAHKTPRLLKQFRSFVGIAEALPGMIWINVVAHDLCD